MKVGSLAGILVIACMGLLSAQAQGKAQAPTDVVIYDIDAYDGPNVLAFGQIFSSKESCSANRKFKLIATTGSATEVVDKGKSSDEGGVAVAFDETELGGITGIGIVVPKTSKCAQGSAPFIGGKVAARAKPAKSQVEIVNIDGENKDGAVAGVVTSGKSQCVAKRKVELFVDGRQRDAGTTSKAGAFGLHITAHEAKDGADIKVSLKKTSECSGGTGRFQPDLLPRSRFLRAGGANADVKIYDNEIVIETFAITFGQVFSSKSDCVSGRKFKLVDEKGNKSKTIDTGKTSGEGALSGAYLSNRIKGKLFFRLPETKGCAAAKGLVGDPAKPDQNLPKAIGTIPLIADIDGRKDDGAVAGIIVLTKRGECFSNRKMKLVGDGEVLDRGRSSRNSSFALHLTLEESQTVEQLTVKVAKSKTKSGETCSGGQADVTGGGPTARSFGR